MIKSNFESLKKSSDILKPDINEWLMDNSSLPETESEQTEEALIRFANEHAISPPAGLRDKILNKIETLEHVRKDRQTIELTNLPMLDETSNWLDWQEAVKDIQPPGHFAGVHLHPLESNKHRDLFVAWVKEYIEEEVHSNLLESFILLEGTCECHITDANGNARVVRMGVGDFITMHVGEVHDVIITSLEPAKAILQWKKIA